LVLQCSGLIRIELSRRPEPHRGPPQRRGRSRLTPAEATAINCQIIARHPFVRETAFEFLAYNAAVKRLCERDRGDGRLDIVNDKAGNAFLDNFWHGTAPERDDRRSGRHRFDLNQAEGFRPIDREQQGRGLTEERPLVGLADLADKLDQRVLQHRQDLTLEIGAIGRIDLGCDLQRHAGAQRDFDGAIGTFLSRDAAEKSEISPAAIAKPVEVARQPMIHRGLPIGPGHRLALRV